MASDSPNQNLSQYFPACNDFIHTARIQGSHSNVLIHCLAGMSRSVTIAIAYVMSITTLRWDEALKAVRGARAVSNPNSGFQKQLQEYEATRLFEERRRLADKYPGTTFVTSDIEHCKRLISSYNNLLISRAICEVRCSSALICPSGTCRTTYGSPRLGRQKSVEASSVQAAATSSVGNASFRGTHHDSTSSPSGSPQASPKSWERHYGCWKNHFRQRQSSTGSAPGSAPGSPILFRVSKGQRSDSMTSIAASNTSLNSLPHHLTERDQFGGSGVISGSGSRSCPNSPRRMPKKLPRTGSQRSEINRDLGSSSASSLRYHHTAGSSKSTPSVWAVSQQPVQSTCSRFNSHNSAASVSLAHSSVVGSNTRWVMKRSAYRYNMDNS